MKRTRSSWNRSPTKTTLFGDMTFNTVLCLEDFALIVDIILVCDYFDLFAFDDKCLTIVKLKICIFLFSLVVINLICSCLVSFILMGHLCIIFCLWRCFSDLVSWMLSCHLDIFGCHIMTLKVYLNLLYF